MEVFDDSVPSPSILIEWLKDYFSRMKLPKFKAVEEATT